MNCKYCGLKAGFFSKTHKKCEEKHNHGLSVLLSSMKLFFDGQENISNVLLKIRTLENTNFLTHKDLEQCCKDSLKYFTETIKLPITKLHLQIVDIFINNIGISRIKLNEKGILDNVAEVFYRGILSSFFVDNEPISKVEKRLNYVEQVLPLEQNKKDTVKLEVYEKAIHNYLNKGIITDSEQAQLDTYSNSLSLSISNKYKSVELERLQQTKILKQIKKGQRPIIANISLPICYGTGEYPIWEYPNVTMYQEKITREWIGRNRGMSFRIMRGVYYRTGNSKGHPFERSTMENVGIGSLVLTNKSLIFYSSSKSSKTSYKKLIGILPYSDGIEVQKDSSNPKRQVFKGFDPWFIVNILSYIN